MFGSNTMYQLEKVLSTEINKGQVAGASMLVIKNGQEVFYHEDGHADVEMRHPIKRDTIFRLYSMTKPITATALMILVERGQIDLFDPVRLFLPGFEGQKVEAYGNLVDPVRDVTIKDLLSMTSGLVYPNEDSLAGQATGDVFQEINQKLFEEKALNTQDIANRLGRCPLAFQPGSSWQYSTSADVLGAVVEVVSGQSFGKFLEQELFAPLGMVDTGFWVPASKQERMAYIDTGNHLGIIDKMDRRPAFESGGAGLVSTIDDYAKFAQMLIQDGTYEKVDILRPKTVEYLTGSTLQSIQQKGFDSWHTLSGYSYGNLMRVMVNQRQAGLLGSHGEYGWDGWLGCYFCNDPKEDMTLLVMMQKKDAGTTSLTRKLRNIVYSSI